HYIYTMRRYITIILPALILGIAWACRFLWSRIRPKPLGVALAALIAIGLAAFFVYTSRTIIQHVEEQGAVAQLMDLRDKYNLGSKSVVLFSEERDEPNVIATPLQFIFGVESFVVNHDYPNVDNKVLEGV